MRRRTLLVIAITVLLVPACGGGGENGGEPAATETKEAVEAGNPQRGKEIFLTSGCGACHTFRPAGSTRNVGPNLDKAVRRYDAEFIQESIVKPEAYIEKGQGGSIGGKEPYGTEMPAYGPEEQPPQKLSEQQVADLVAFLMQGKK